MILLASLETALNALLARDPAAATRLGALAGKRLIVRLDAPPLQLLLQCHEHGLHLQWAGDDDAADASIGLDGATLGALLSGESIERLMLGGRLQVRGNPSVLEGIRDLLLDLDADVEGGLAHVLGASPAHQLAESVRRLERFGRRSARQLRADLDEYVFEEARLLPGQAQLGVARDHLTELGIAIDRLDARLARLEKRSERRIGQRGQP